MPPLSFSINQIETGRKREESDWLIRVRSPYVMGLRRKEAWGKVLKSEEEVTLETTFSTRGNDKRAIGKGMHTL